MNRSVCICSSNVNRFMVCVLVIWADLGGPVNVYSDCDWWLGDLLFVCAYDTMQPHSPPPPPMTSHNSRSCVHVYDVKDGEPIKWNWRFIKETVKTTVTTLMNLLPIPISNCRLSNKRTTHNVQCSMCTWKKCGGDASSGSKRIVYTQNISNNDAYSLVSKRQNGEAEQK